MTGSEKIFFDTAPFIYLIEDHPTYAGPVAEYIADQVSIYESHLFTSVLTLAEFSVKPKRNNKKEIIDQFRSKLDEYDFTAFDVTKGIAEYSADLRAKYISLRLFDALQLATAISLGCNKFFTNDHALKKIKEIKVMTIEDLLT
ncbi:MAG: type II toxin-antitoxin system VapC family toxin [Bacteroidota bacterium]